MNDHRPNEKTIRHIRWMIWLYFWLLIFEGALRKWVVPALSNPLLIVRDPVALAAYILALRAGIFPWNRWVKAIALISVLSVALSFVQMWPYLSPFRIALVAGFGFRSDFLHLPLIFLIPRVMRLEDVKRLGWWTLVLILPMTLLMVGQFRSAPDAFLNWTAGGEGESEMMLSALGKVRTAATFSFVVGVVAYFSLATAYVMWAALRRDVYPVWLLIAAGSAIVIGVAVSGSRSVVAACAVVVASLLVVLLLRPSAVNRFGQTLLAVIVCGFILTKVPIFKEGFEVLTTRFNEVAQASDKSIGVGMIERIAGTFQDGFFVLTKAPFLGYGLGIGTNAGAKFLTGRSMFLLSEGEWSRNLLESGPVLGLAFVLWRLALVIAIALLCLRSVRRGNLLPLLLFASSAPPLLSGQFGQPTILGFAVFTTGLALAAKGVEDLAPEPNLIAADPAALPPRRPMRRSAYTSRLHGPSTPQRPGHTNGSVDR